MLLQLINMELHLFTIIASKITNKEDIKKINESKDKGLEKIKRKKSYKDNVG